MWANEMLPIVETARDELGGSATLKQIADWLNEHGYRTKNNRLFEGKNLGATLFSIDNVIAGDAVMECRAKMTAQALSAKFEIPIEYSHSLQVECIERIKDGIRLARTLERRRPLLNAELTVEAQQMAIDHAKMQREDFRYLPLLARSIYLTDSDYAEIVPDIEQMILRERSPPIPD